MNATTLFYETFSTPSGDFSIAVDQNGALAATAFGGRAELASRLNGETLVAADSEAASTTKASNATVENLLRPVRRQVLAYFAGELREFDLPLAAAGTPFQRRVWTALQQIPFGITRTYGDLARELRSAPRAVGRANATNPICLIVPCHRVIGADGSLTGFAFGEDVKRQLLDHERATAESAARKGARTKTAA